MCLKKLFLVVGFLTVVDFAFAQVPGHWKGTAQQDRDETIFGHKPFLVIADYLTRRGIAVLRVDDRNAGKSTGPENGTSADFTEDAMASFDFLQIKEKTSTR